MSFLKTELLFIIVLLVSIINISNAQQFSDYSKGVDTLGVKEYKQVLPIWGKKVIEKGFNLPEPLGISTYYMYLNQGLLLENLFVGIEGGDNSKDPVALDDFLNFKELTTSGSIFMVKPDFWLLPFLNIYGILGYVDINTKVVLDQPIDLETNVRTKGYNYGFGAIVAAGFKSFWLSGNFNWTWTKLSNLDQPNFARITSVRIGKANNIGKKGKLTYWLGMMHQKWGRTVSGAFNLNEILGDLPDETIPGKVRESEKYQDSSPAQKAVIDPVLDAIDEVGQGKRDNYDNLKMTYSVDKAPDHPWNMVAGANYAITRHWYIQTEFGFIGRFTAMAGVNYRFHL